MSGPMDAEEPARVRTLSPDEVFDKFTPECARLEAEIERLAMALRKHHQPHVWVGEPLRVVPLWPHRRRASMTAVLEWGDQARRAAFVQPITLRDPNIADTR